MDERPTAVPSGTCPTVAGVAPLTACPRCGSRLLQPLRSRPRSSDEVLVDLRCPECETWMQSSFTKADAEELDRLQSACRDQIVTAYEQSVSESMRALAFNLATALERSTWSAPTTSRRGAGCRGLPSRPRLRAGSSLRRRPTTAVSRPSRKRMSSPRDVDVDEAAQVAVAVGDPLAQLGVLVVEAVEHLADRRAVDARLGLRRRSTARSCVGILTVTAIGRVHAAPTAPPRSASNATARSRRPRTCRARRRASSGRRR